MKRYLPILVLCFSYFISSAQNIAVTIDLPLPVCQPGDCTSLLANYTSTKPTGTYTVASLPYVVPGFTTVGQELALTDINHECPAGTIRWEARGPVPQHGPARRLAPPPRRTAPPAGCHAPTR